MTSRTPARMTTAPAPSAAGTCDASMADGTNLFGPCILRHRHDGPVHKDATGTRWALPDRSGDPVLASRSKELAELRDQLARFHEGEEPVTSALHEATPAQWIWKWNRSTPEQRLDMASRIQDAFARSSACFQGGHEARLDQQQARLTRLEKDAESSDLAVRRAMEQRQEMATERYALQEHADAAERRAEQAEDLLRVAHETSNTAEAERASAVRSAELADAVTAETKRLMERRTTTLRTRAERAEERRDELTATLHDVLRHFTQKGHPGEPCLQTGWIAEKTVARWRAVLNPPATEEQPEDTAQCWRKEPHVPHTWTLSPEEGGVDCPGVDRPATKEQPVPASPPRDCLFARNGTPPCPTSDRCATCDTP